MRILEGPEHWLFLCPGCEYGHAVFKDGRWTFNGDFERPTFSPSLAIEAQGGRPRCHSFVKDGRIEFLGDSTHKLSGQTVDLPEMT